MRPLLQTSRFLLCGPCLRFSWLLCLWFAPCVVYCVSSLSPYSSALWWVRFFVVGCVFPIFALCVRAHPTWVLFWISHVWFGLLSFIMVSSLIGVSNLRHPPQLGLKFTAPSVVERQELSVLSLYSVLTRSVLGCPLGSSLVSFVLQITCSMHETFFLRLG